MSEKYISPFQFVGSSVQSFKIKNDFIGIEDEDKLRHKLDVSHSITSIERIEDEEILMGTLLLKIKVSLSEKKRKYAVDLSIQGCFVAPFETGEDNFLQMMKINGISSLYSIARSFIHSTTSQTLMSGCILLPMFNVAAYSKDLDEQESEPKQE